MELYRNYFLPSLPPPSLCPSFVGSRQLPDHPLTCPQAPPTCTPPTLTSSHPHNSTVVVVGALGALGAWLSMRLHGASWNVRAVAMDTDISTNELMWYRYQQLRNVGVKVTFLNLSNSSHVTWALSPTPTHIVYVHPAMELEATPPCPAHWGRHMSQFVSLLEGVSQLAPCTQLVMSSLSSQTGSHDNHMTSERGHTADTHDSHMAIQLAHMTAYESALLSYHALHSLQFTVVRTGPPYGPWTSHALSLWDRVREVAGRMEEEEEEGEGEGELSLHSMWYITDVSLAVEWALRRGASCEVLDIGVEGGGGGGWGSVDLPSPLSVRQGVKRTLSWVKSYVDRRGKGRDNDVILTSYFTSEKDFQRGKLVAPNRLRYMLQWLVSVRDLGLRAVVFHDGLNPAFCHRVIQYHSGISFRRVSLAGRTTNDARFYAYQDYLQTHPDITRVLLSDISDVKFLRNPFDLMRFLGDWLYVGTDIDIFPNMQAQRWITERLQGCFGNYTLLNGSLMPLMRLDTVYNAGVIGGRRTVMLGLLERMTQSLDTTPPSLNCNMPALNFVIHRHFFQRVFTGFPLTSRFLRFQTDPRGVYVVHK